MKAFSASIAFLVLTAFTSPTRLYCSETGCDFDKGNCGLDQVIYKAKNLEVPRDIPGPVRAYSPNIQNTGASFREVSQDIRRLAPFVQDVQKNTIRLQIFDAKAALKNGFSPDTVLLVQEIVEFQNCLMTASATGKKNVMAEPIDTVKYPRLSTFLKMRRQEKPESISTPIEPCGELSFPVPDHRPQRYPGTSSNPEQTLLELGFHYTWGYACGDYVEIDCDHDFTQGVWNFGPYGYCEKPLFRMHGATDPKRPTWYSMHGPEPNPELNTYVWPYPTWGVYVYWWHHEF